jgi:hypothetical protein
MPYVRIEVPLANWGIGGVPLNEWRQRAACVIVPPSSTRQCVVIRSGARFERLVWRGPQT